jgi:hypothetical protein
MAANTSPIFTLTPNIGIGGAILGPTANTSLDGTGSAAYLIFTAGTNGSRISSIRFKSVSSTAATVARVFYCSATGTFTAGTTNTTSTTSLITEITLAAATLSQTNANQDYSILINESLPASTKIFVTFGTSTGSSGVGFAVTAFGGDY